MKLNSLVQFKLPSYENTTNEIFQAEPTKCYAAGLAAIFSPRTFQYFPPRKETVFITGLICMQVLGAMMYIHC